MAEPSPNPGNAGSESEIEILSSRPEAYDDAGNAAVIPQEAPLQPEALSEVEEWKKKHEEVKEKLLWMAADFDNYKKRALKEKEEFLKFSHSGLLKEFLAVVDNLERAVAHSSKPGEKPEAPAAGLREGVELTLRQFHNLLQKHGVAKIKAVGEKFDPRFHEVVMQEETDKFPDGTVMEEMQGGYTLQERVLRPAMVKVSKGKPSAGG